MTDDIAYSDIVIYMFLNYANGVNEYKGLLENGCKHLFVYGHAKEQYAVRFAALQNLLNLDLLQYDKLERKCIDLIGPRQNRCADNNGLKVRNVIRDEVHLLCGGQHFIVDIAVLVAGTRVNFYKECDRVVLDQYKDIYNKGIIKVGDQAIAIETVNVTIRLEGERILNFGNHPTLCYLGLPKKVFNVKKKDIIDIVEPMLEDEKKFGHIVTKEVKKIEERYKKQLMKKVNN